MKKYFNYPDGKDLIAEYRRRFGDKSLLGFSRGKDSIATAILLKDQIEMYPIFFYIVPGLPLIEETLDYYSRTLFGGKRVIQYPEAAFFAWLAQGLYQTPHTHRIIQAAALSVHGHSWWKQIIDWTCDDLGFGDEVLNALGMRAVDSPIRYLNIKNHGVIRPGPRNWLPIWNYTKTDVQETIRKAGVSLPPDYALFGHSFSGNLAARHLVPLKRHRPEDWKIVCEWFPLADLAVWKYERFVEGKK